ncbi:MAG: PIG-L family deacetylase, partial [Acidobacteriota bacterium]|nr:PIG-L family deacetylase [Acidobacteriota bacterium]
RRAEAAESAGLIGAEYRCLEFRDMSIFSDDPSRRRVTEFLRAVRPDLIFTSSPADYLSDHEMTSRLVRDACFAATIPNYATGSAPLSKIPHLYFMDPIDERITPDLWIDVTAVFDTKRAMLAQHRSQGNWLSQQHGIDDYLVQMERWTRENGERAGYQYAEGFRQHKVHPFPQTPGFELP